MLKLEKKTRILWVTVELSIIFMLFFLSYVGKRIIGSTESLLLTGTLTQKIVSLGNALVSFAHLRHLDLSRNYISSLDGLQYCQVIRLYLVTYGVL